VWVSEHIRNHPSHRGSKRGHAAMANPEHLAILKHGVEEWNEWRRQHPDITPDLCDAPLTKRNLSEVDFNRADLKGATLTKAKLNGAHLAKAQLGGADLTKARLKEASLNGATLEKANLIGANLSQATLNGANLMGADLNGAHLYEARLWRAQLSEASLNEAYFKGAILSGADLTKAKLRGTNLIGVSLNGANLKMADLSGANLAAANLSGANLIEANLSGANLQRALLIGTHLEAARLADCRVYGMSVWDAYLKDAIQSNLIITPEHQPIIQVDSLDVAQFIYLLLNNQNIRHVIDTITSKVVLILGRFTRERMAVLEAIRSELRKRDYLPVLFDFEKPASQTTEETISTLAHMARFVIADLTDAKSVLQELRVIVPNSPSVFVQPLLLATQEEPGMFDFFRMFPWVLEPVRYNDQKLLIAGLDENVITPAESKARALPSR